MIRKAIGAALLLSVSTASVGAFAAPAKLKRNAAPAEKVNRENATGILIGVLLLGGGAAALGSGGGGSGGNEGPSESP